MTQRDIYRTAKKRVKKKKAFFSHLSSYVGVSMFLVFINLFTSPGYFWAIFPIAGWGLGIFFHAIGTFGSSDWGREWERKEMDKEIRRLEGNYDEKEEYLELKDLKELRPRYRDSDFV